MVDGSPFAWPRRNPTFLGPGPNLPEKLAIEPGTTQVMQQARDLILANPLGPMTQHCGYRRAHARSPHRMRPIVPANDPARVIRVRIIVETHQLGQERTRNQERGTCLGKSHHELGNAQTYG